MDGSGRQWAIERISDLLVRLDMVRWPSRSVPTVAAGAISAVALEALEEGVRMATAQLRGVGRELRSHLRSGAMSWQQAHPQVVALQLQADALFRTVDLYADAIVTRTDAHVATMLAGTDELLRDALARPIAGYEPPLTVCYLDAGGRGGAINRARTRLPGGIVLPVALVRISPESLPARLSSCLHEAGHQLSVDLDLLKEGGHVVESAAFEALKDRDLAAIWGSWISELLADCWSIGLSGGAPGVDGLQRLLSLPNSWLLSVVPGDPHPPGYLRNRFALRLARLWHPHPILNDLERRFHVSLATCPGGKLAAALDVATWPVARALGQHRFRGLYSSSLASACGISEVAPARALAALYQLDNIPLIRHRPLLALATLGYGRLSGAISPRHYAARARSWLTQLAEQRFRRVAHGGPLLPTSIRPREHAPCPCHSSTIQ